ncbi:hypothetical protein CHS0354_011794, partial [Potamilus streckersoni]
MLASSFQNWYALVSGVFCWPFFICRILELPACASLTTAYGYSTRKGHKLIPSMPLNVQMWPNPEAIMS